MSLKELIHAPLNVSRLHRIGIVTILSLVAFAPTFQTGFMWDDHVMIETNPALQSWSVSALKQDFSSDVFRGLGDPYFRPGQTLLNRVDYTVWGLRAFGYHLTNWLGHVGCAVLVMELALVIGLSGMAAFLAGTLFAVHPIIVQELMIIAGRAEIFGLFFLLLSLWLLLSPSKPRQIGGYAAFVMSLLFKESAAIAPALLAILLAWKHQPAREYRKILPLFLLLFPYLILRHSAIGLGDTPLITPLTLKFWFMAFPRVIGYYAQLLLWPWNLHSHHMIPRLSLFWPFWLVLWPALLVALWKTRMRQTFWGLLWAIVCFFPKTPAMVYGGFMLEHWAYPSLVAITWGLGAFFSSCWDAPKKPLSRVMIPGYLLILITWALLAQLSVALRGTDEKNYRWSLRYSSSHPIQYNLGILLLQTRRPQEALPYLENVRAVYPDNARNLHALAQSYWLSGHRNVAISVIKEAALKSPTDHDIQKTLRKMNSK